MNDFEEEYEENFGDQSENDSEDISEDDDYFQLVTEDEYEERELSDSFKPVIDKVRKIVKNFTRSPVKNDILQSYVKSDFKCERELKLDSKTRWNSLVDMLERFYEIRKSIQKALIDVRDIATPAKKAVVDSLEIDEQEIRVISEKTDALKPVKAAVEALCR